MDLPIFAYQEVGQNAAGQARRAVPRFKSNAGLRVEWERFSAEVWWHYYGAAVYPLADAFSALAPFRASPIPDPRVGSYNLLNLRAGYRFWQQKAAAGYFREAEVAVSAFNALNDRHREHPLSEVIGSQVLGWLTLKF